MVNRMPSEGAGAVGIDRDDAISYGVEGLIHAVDAYRPRSRHDLRQLRHSAHPRRRFSTPCESRTLCLARCEGTPSRSSTRHRSWLCSLGRWPTHKEIAFKLGIPLSRLQHLLGRASSRLVSLEYSLEDRPNYSSNHAWDPVDDDVLSDPARAAEQRAAL